MTEENRDIEEELDKTEEQEHLKYDREGNQVRE